MSKLADILIADAGGTSTQWCLVTPEGAVRQSLTGAPINAAVHSDSQIADALSEISGMLQVTQRVCFYGAGCSNHTDCQRVVTQLENAGFIGEAEVYTDMMGAARALFGDNPGIACILGTGANSCLYDGREIVENIPPLGYILGDEGGGAAIGKRFLKALIRRELPPDLTDRFFTEPGNSVASVYENVYRRPVANKYLASLTRYVYENLGEACMRQLVTDEFTLFLSTVVSRYSRATELPVSFIGSVAYYFADILKECAATQGLTVGQILRDPMEGLIRYHSRSSKLENNFN